MLPCNPGSQDTFVSQVLKFYPDPFVLPKSTWDYIVQFWYLDLSKTDPIMQECYSVFGPEPRLPSRMPHSYLLALKLKVTSIAVWCRMLKETPLYAILSGFSFGDTSGVGTFYDFFSHIRQDDSNNLSQKDRFPKIKKTPKGKKKGDKTPCYSSSMASRLLPLLERWHLKPENPFSLILPNTGQNTAARNQTGNVAASVNTLVHRRNMVEPYTSLPMTIQGYLTYRQGTLKHGKRNMIEELPWSAPTSVRKRTIN